jgi:hypothetical protein
VPLPPTPPSPAWSPAHPVLNPVQLCRRLLHPVQLLHPLLHRLLQCCCTPIPVELLHPLLCRRLLHPLQLQLIDFHPLQFQDKFLPFSFSPLSRQHPRSSNFSLNPFLLAWAASQRRLIGSWPLAVDAAYQGSLQQLINSKSTSKVN